MLFKFSQPNKWVMWSNKMKFDFDVIFIKDNQILEVAENVSSQFITFVTSKKPATEILEVKAGFSAEIGLRPGQQVLIYELAD
jgi:uncharacterized membrane protein (UPF0127 family)